MADLEALASLGKIAGIGGIAIGAVVLLLRPIIDGVSKVPEAQRAGLLRFIAVGAFGIGALGLLVWLFSGLSMGNVIVKDGGIAAGRDVVGGVQIGAPTQKDDTPPAPAAGPSIGNVSATGGGIAAGRDVILTPNQKSPPHE